MKINENEKMEEAITAEFFTDDDQNILVDFCGKRMTIKSFLELCKTNYSAHQVADELKKKMIKMKYHGDLLGFIMNYFLKYNDTYDITIYGDVDSPKRLVRFDTKELPA